MAQQSRKKKEFLKSFEDAGCNVSVACQAVKIGRSSFYRWLRDDPAFHQTISDLREGLIDRAESALLQKIDGGDLGAICFFLKCQGQARHWVEKPFREPKWIEPEESIAILEDLLNGSIDAVEAGIRYAKAGLPLPAVLEKILSKTTIPEPESRQPWSSLSMEEFEERLESGTLITDQEEQVWLGQRREEVKKIKEETKTHNSFGPEVIDQAATAKTA